MFNFFRVFPDGIENGTEPHAYNNRIKQRLGKELRQTKKSKH